MTWDGYDGAIVLDPKCDLYLDKPVACVDYASLYPSSMISENLSHDSKVWTKNIDLSGNMIDETGEKMKTVLLNTIILKIMNMSTFSMILLGM